MAEWISLKDIADGAKFYVRAAIKDSADSARACRGNFIPENGLVYLVSDNA